MRLRPPLVLAYHAIGDVARRHDPHDLVVSEQRLRSQLERLVSRDYEFVKLSDFTRRLRAGARLEGVCALTFDDGSLDNAVVLPPLLDALGLPATLFVCPGLLGRPHPWLAPEAGVRLMDGAELDSLSGLDSIEIGSHTNLHLDLSDHSEEEAYSEMRSSKEALEDRLGRPVESFAYPFCAYSPACPRAAERAGYTSAVTCGLRGGWRPYELRRELIDPWDGRLRFALKSHGLHRPIVLSPPLRLARRLSGSDAKPSRG